jgi:hypothetical protein
MAEFSSRHFAHYFFLTQMIVAYHWRDWKEADRYCDLSGEYQADSQGMLHHAANRAVLTEKTLAESFAS